VDDRTIEAARRGDRAARAELLRDLQDVWYRLSLSLLHQAELARDATQETALRFLRDLPNFRGHSQLRTWSLGIAINVAREMRRKSGRAAHDDEATRLSEARRGVSAPDAEAAANEERENLRRLLDDLPDRQREVIVLRFFEDLPVAETARAMDCAEGTVKATLFQAIRALRSKMTQLTRDES
jgi:RNA polymerase sigma-70 factor (ECF subfamily)